MLYVSFIHATEETITFITILGYFVGRYVVFDHLTNGEYMKIEKMNGLEIMEAIIR